MRNVLQKGAIGFGLLLAFLAGPSQAQAQGYLLPTQRPTVNPMLNLLNQGQSQAINLYGVVRPEVAFRNSINQLDQQQTGLADQQQNLLNYTAVPPTGQLAGGARFMTQSRYFMTNSGRGGAGGGGGRAGGTGGGAGGAGGMGGAGVTGGVGR